MNGTAPKVDDDEAFPDVPAVENGEINYLSVSQLKTAALCRRKWWFKKVAGLEEPKSAALEIGTQVHAELEHYLKTGEDVLGEIARPALKYLPEPKAPSTFGLEVPITSQVRPTIESTLYADGIPLVGFIDRIDRLAPRTDGEVISVTDYKTSSNPEKYGATPEQLTTTEHEHGIQMVGYALAVSSSPRVAQVFLEHLTLHKKPTKAERKAGLDVKQVVASITPKKARDEWERMNLLARSLRQVAKISRVEDTPSSWNTDACSAYGGCHFFGTCLVAESKRNATPQPEVKGKPMSLKNLLANRKATTAPPPAEPKPVEVKVETPPQTSGSVTVETKTEPIPDVVPPDAPKSDPKLAAEQPPEPGKNPDPENPKKRLGRRPKADPNDKFTAAPGEVIEPLKPEEMRGSLVPPPAEPGPTTEQLAEKYAKQLEDALTPPGFALFVDCVPFSAERCASFGDYVAQRVTEISKAFPDLLDIRIAPKKGKNGEGKDVDHPLAYGAWKGVLAAQCRLNPPKGNVAALGVYGSEFMQVAIEALEPLASLVVRGVR